MEICILKDEKDTIELQIKGEDHTFCNLLRSELAESEDSAAAGYSIKHPLVSIPMFFVTAKKGKPKKLLLDAVESLKSKTKEMKSLLKNLN